jgi:hypothetical protein
MQSNERAKTHIPMFLVGNNFTRAQLKKSLGKKTDNNTVRPPLDAKQQSLTQFLTKGSTITKIVKPQPKKMGYWEQRVAKLQDQTPDIEIFKHVDIVKKGTLIDDDKENLRVKQIFKGLSFYLNGRTIISTKSSPEISNSNMSQLHLGKLAVLHGAVVLYVDFFDANTFRPYIAKKQLTHVICSQLCFSKREKVGKTKLSANACPVKYVHPQVLFHCGPI